MIAPERVNGRLQESEYAQLQAHLMVSPVGIRTPRLAIRELTNADTAALTMITSDSDVTRYLSFGPTREAEVRGLIDFAISSSQATPRMDYALAVVRASDDVLVGSCGLAIDPDTLDSAEVYFVLRADVWGQGLASELLPALLTLGFERLAVQRIFGVAHPENVTSQHVMVRSGMTFDGRILDAFEGAHGWLEGNRYTILRA